MVVDKLTTGQITNENSFIYTDETYSTGRQQFCIAIPPFETGSYTVALYNDSTDPIKDGLLLFGFTAQRVGDTINITYGRKSESIQEFRVALDGSIHIITKWGRKLYFTRTSINETEDIKTFDEYPYNEEDYIYVYECHKDHANIYTSWDGIDILGHNETAIGNSSISLGAVSKISEASNATIYRPFDSDKTFRVYKPDQDVNKASDVSFNSISLPIPSGKYLIMENGKITGSDLAGDFVDSNTFNTEIDSLKDSDTTIRQSISTLSSNVTQKINDTKTELEGKINNIDTTSYVNEKVAAEAALRVSDIGNINNSISSLSNTVSANKKSIEDSLDTEIGNREKSEETINGSITSVENALASYKETVNAALKNITDRLEVLESKVANIEKNYVTTDTNQTITGLKTVTNSMIFKGNAPIIPTTKPSNATTPGALYYV